MTARIAFIAIVSSLLASCTTHAGSITPPVPASGAVPYVVQKGGGKQFVEFNPKTVGALFSAIVEGPDGNIWFLDENAHQLVRMSMGGSIKEFDVEAELPGNAVSMAVGADGKFYITDESTSITRVSTGGKAVEIPIPSGDSTAIDGIAAGPDGNVWFTEFDHIAKVTPGGVITEFAYTSGGTNQYGGVTAGSDGNVWFAQSSQNQIGRINPTTGAIKMFTIPGSCTPAAVVLAKDNNVWFFCLTTAPTLGKITPSGKITTFPIGGTFSANETEQFCERGPDGEPWCASGNDGVIFRVNTSAHTVTTFTPPLSPGARPDAVAPGPDGNVWMDSVGDDIDVLVLDPMTVSPTKLSFSGNGQTMTVTVSENGVSSWTATSSNTAVATVAQGNSASTFAVTSVGAGTCKIVISDGAGNSVAVKVTVI
jgi:streptogramin lyase